MTEYNIWCFGLLKIIKIRIGLRKLPRVIVFNIFYNIKESVYVVYVAQESSCAY